MCTGYKAIVLWGLDVMADFGWFLCAVYTLLLWRAIPQLALELSCIFTLSPCANCGITCYKEANLPIYSFVAEFTSHFKFPIWTYVFSFAIQEEVAFCWWTGFFDQWSREILWATMQILKYSQHREARQRPGSCCHHLGSALIWNWTMFFVYFIYIYYLFILFLVALGLHCFVWVFSSCGVQQLLFVQCMGFSLPWLLLLSTVSRAWASAVAEHRLSSCCSRALESGLNNCDPRA